MTPRRTSPAACCALLLLAGGVLRAQSPAECQKLRRAGKLAEARQCHSRLTNAAAPAVKAEGYWGIGEYDEANRQFAACVKTNPKSADCRVRWGALMAERFNPADASQLYQEALEIAPNHTGAMLGLARLAAADFETRAVAMAEKALQTDPKLVEARELLARLALEDGDTERARKEADAALALSPQALDAMAVRATMEWLEDRPGEEWAERIRKANPVYGEAWAAGARVFVLNRRYEEAIALYQRALELNPQLWGAHSELGIQYMRLGRDDEARRHLEIAYNNRHRDPGTVNSLRLLDSYKNFTFARTANGVLKLHRKEADALRPYFEQELERSLDALEKKYGHKMARPVRIEVYPDHEDFAVRALGMPGLGALGVTFGDVVAMDSPSGRRKGSFHWASTLWHELSHVYTLSMTRHRIPRWFTEGVAVHEETAASPEWGDRLSPEVITAIRDKKLLPVAKLDRGFIRPSYPAQVVVSYFQAGRICDYIVNTWGEKKLVEMIHAFGAKKSTPEVIRETLGLAPEEFDKRFLAALNQETAKVVAGFEDWRKRATELRKLAAAGSHAEVIRLGPAVRDLYPEYVEEASAYELIANAHLARKDEPSAAAELERYARAGGRSPELLKKLGALHETAKRPKEAIAALTRLTYIDPLDQELHQKLGSLLLAQGDARGAIREYSALIALKPHDQADAHFQLARAYRAARQNENAREHLLLALEAAPGFRPAQKMLLEMTP